MTPISGIKKILEKENELIQKEKADYANRIMGHETSKDHDEVMRNILPSILDDDFNDFQTDYIMDFCSITPMENKKANLLWYRMRFYDDFGESLKDYGRVPYESIELAMKDHRDKDREM